LRSSMMFVLVLVLVLSRTYSIPTLYNSAVALKAWYKVNEQMLMWIAALSENSRLLFFSFSNDHEYIFEVRLLLGLLYDRADIVIDGISNAEDLRRQARSGDLLLINFGEEANRHVWVRGVQAVPPLEYSKRSVASATSGMHLEEAFRAESEKKILPPFSARPHSLVLGWAGYRVATHPE
jgi:hypothetical protein